jgi:hypothetical protein
MATGIKFSKGQNGWEFLKSAIIKVPHLWDFGRSKATKVTQRLRFFPPHISHFFISLFPFPRMSAMYYVCKTNARFSFVGLLLKWRQSCDANLPAKTPTNGRLKATMIPHVVHVTWVWPRAELCSLGWTWPSVVNLVPLGKCSRGEHTLLFRRMEGQTDNFTPND